MPQCLIEEIQKALDKNPEQMAVCDNSRSYSGQELRDFVCFVSHVLNENHLKKVAIMGEPSFVTASSVLSALISSAVYVPIEPSWPLNRINKILQHSGAEGALSNSSVLKKHKLNFNDFSVPVFLDVTEEASQIHKTTAGLKKPEGQKTFCIKKYLHSRLVKTNFSAESPKTWTFSEKTDSSLAYIMYTSGSTGEPKGVEVSMRALEKFLHWVKAEFQISSSDRLSYTASLGFGASIRQIFSPVLSGALMVCFPRETVKSPSVFLDALKQKQITVFNAPPIVLQQLARQAETQEGGVNKKFLSAVRLILAGGDLFPKEILDLWYRQFQHPHTVVNLYGSTESIVNASCYKVKRSGSEMSSYKFLPIGQARPGLSFLLLDEKACPIDKDNEPGELYIQSKFLCKGYHNNKEETQRVFSQLGKKTLYNTGDRAVLLDSKNYLVLGREDSQIQIYGQRVELGEIENTLNSHPKIQRALAVHFKDGGFDKITAYIQMKDGEVYEEPALRNFLNHELPVYMRPHHFQQIKKIPITGSNKVDYKKLKEKAQAEFYKSKKPAPEGLKGRDVFSLSDLELAREIRDVWQKYLGPKPLPEDQSFFDAGGDSVMAAQLYNDLYQKFSVPLDPYVFYTEPSIHNLILALRQAQSKTDQTALKKDWPDSTAKQPANQPQNIKKFLISAFLKILKLNNKIMAFLYRKPSVHRGLQSPQQKSFIFMKQIFNEIYNGCFSIPIEGHFDKDKFKKAGELIISSQESLRTVFAGDEQIVLPEYPLEILFYDLRNREEEEQKAVIKNTEDRILQEKFDFASLPLFKLAVLEQSSEKFHFIFGINHIVGDGWSIQAFLSALNASYGFFNKAGPKPPVHSYLSYTKSYKDFCRSRFKANQDFWNRKFSDLSSYNLSPQIEKTMPSVGKEESRKLDKHFIEKLSARAKALNTRDFYLYLALWAESLSEFLNCQKICFWTTYHGRDFPFPGIPTMIGSIARAAPLLIDLPAQRENPLLATAQKAYTESLRHKDFNILKSFISHKSRHISENWIGFNYLNFKILDQLTNELPFRMDWSRGQVRLSSSRQSYKKIYMFFSVHDYKNYTELKVYGKALDKHKKQILNLMKEKMDSWRL